MLIENNGDMMIKWPRGKYNGQRITGIKISFECDITRFYLRMSFNFGEPYLFIGPFFFRFYLVYRK